MPLPQAGGRSSCCHHQPCSFGVLPSLFSPTCSEKRPGPQRWFWVVLTRQHVHLAPVTCPLCPGASRAGCCLSSNGGPWLRPESEGRGLQTPVPVGPGRAPALQPRARPLGRGRETAEGEQPAGAPGVRKGSRGGSVSDCRARMEPRAELERGRCERVRETSSAWESWARSPPTQLPEPAFRFPLLTPLLERGCARGAGATAPVA